MLLRRKKLFIKQYKKLSPKTQKKIEEKVRIFVKNPLEKSLYNHPLKGDFEGSRSISVAGDLRIIFKEENNYLVVILIQVGSHSQLY